MAENWENMASVVAAFVLEEGLVVAAPGQMEVNISTLYKGPIDHTIENWKN